VADKRESATGASAAGVGGDVSYGALLDAAGCAEIGTASDPALNLVRFPDGVAGWSMGSGGVASALSVASS